LQLQARAHAVAFACAVLPRRPASSTWPLGLCWAWACALAWRHGTPEWLPTTAGVLPAALLSSYWPGCSSSSSRGATLAVGDRRGRDASSSLGRWQMGNVLPGTCRTRASSLSLLDDLQVALQLCL